MPNKKLVLRGGYSLVELTIGVFVVFIFAIVTLILIDPQQLILQKRDATRLKEVVTLGEGLISYAKSKNGTLPTSNKNWLVDLHARGEISKIPDPIEYENAAALCKTNQHNGFCYTTDGVTPAHSAIVYTKLESVAENTKCNVSFGETAWAVYDLVMVRGGIVCTVGTEPTFNPEGQRFLE